MRTRPGHGPISSAVADVFSPRTWLGTLYLLLTLPLGIGWFTLIVSLAMDLGRARERLETDPQAASDLVARAHEEAKRTLVELRNLARGIHPAILTDRGLDAAISALTARSHVPVTVDVQLGERRPPEQVESIAYFVVAEALANLAKHAAATRASVTAVRSGARIVVEVADDGLGGAVMSPGGGLAGLADRVAAIDVVTEGAVEKHVSSIFQKLRLPPTETTHRRVLAALAYLDR